MKTEIYRLKGDSTPDVYFYPTGQKGKFVKIDHDVTGRPFAQLLVAFDPTHPMWSRLEPVGFYGDSTAPVWLTQQTMFEHLRLIAAEVATLA